MSKGLKPLPLESRASKMEREATSEFKTIRKLLDKSHEASFCKACGAGLCFDQYQIDYLTAAADALAWLLGEDDGVERISPPHIVPFTPAEMKHWGIR